MSQPRNITEAIDRLVHSFRSGERNPWTAVLNDGERFQCFKRLAIERGARYAGSTLENYSLECPAQRSVVAKLRKLQAEGIPGLELGGGLVLHGPQGTGKDHLQFAMLRHAVIEWGRSAMWRDGLGLQSEIRQAVAAGSEPELRKLLAEPQILAISDILPPSGELNDWNLAWIRDVLDRRYRDLKSTWLTFNGTSIDDLKPILTPPVVGRFAENATVLFCSWPSFRKPSRDL